MSAVLDLKPAADAKIIFHRQLKKLAWATGLLLLCFAVPLFRLFSFVAHSELFSFIMLIPFISGYLIWTDRKRLHCEVSPSWPAMILCFLAGAAFLATYGWRTRSTHTLTLEDYSALLMAAFVCCFWGLCFCFLGWKMLRQIAFPIAFLAFVVPLPVSWVASIDIFFQNTSAATAAALCALVGTPVFREGLVLHLPAFSLLVGPECSGIHSTVVLVVTSLLAGYLFLSRFCSRAILVLFVIPLAILRNGFRICVIGELCVHISPQMIDSPIHRKGGPLFFALSLIPFFFLLICLRKWESHRAKIFNAKSPH